MDDPWGLHEPPAPHPEPPAPLPPALAKLAALTEPQIVLDWADWETPGPEALPEVAALLQQGWRLLGDDPRYAVLPAIWPEPLRCWLPDRMPHVNTSFDGRTAWVMPAGQSLHPEYRMRPGQHYAAEFAAEVGLPAPPPDRIWLLRSPWPWVGLRMVQQLFARRGEERGSYEAAEVVAAAREMLQWDDPQLRAWWTGEEADAALAWEEHGRVGEDVVELVRAGLGPNAFAGMPGLTPDQAAAWRWAVAGRNVQDAVDRVVFFRSVGLPVTPPDDLYRLENLDEEALTAWLAAGFDVPTMVELAGFTLDQAIAWRRHGYSPAQAQELLQANSAITAEQVDEFAMAGIVGRHRIDWIRHGFPAADALLYDEHDVQPNEARVWRSQGLGPADVRPGQHLPPDYERGGWVMPANMRLRDAEHSVVDPPGTAGAVAEQSRQARQRFRDY